MSTEEGQNDEETLKVSLHTPSMQVFGGIVDESQMLPANASE